jgi:putative heme iron utilization protein
MAAGGACGAGGAGRHSVRGEPTDAERSRTLIAAVRTGALATIGEGGFPFGSLVSHAVDPVGRPLLLLSDLAEHSRNLAADPRASLMASEGSLAGPSISAEVGTGDPLALARVTVIGRVGELTGEERAAALEIYRAAQPGAFYTGFGDFRLYRLEVDSVRYVGGFGRMSWVDAASYAAAEPDPLRPHAERIIGHMNDDHADALVLFCRRFGNRPGTAVARMVGVDRYGFAMLAADEPGGQETAVRLAFDASTDTPDAVRKAMIELLRRARS